MAKIWRRKKSGREIGSFYGYVDEKPVNLKTQNAKEANKRLRLALAGEWPPGGPVDDAAAAAAPMEHADAAPPESLPRRERLLKFVHDVRADEVENVPQVPPVAVPSCPAAGGPADSDPIAAAAQAAGDVAMDPVAAQDNAEEMRAAMRDLISSVGGSDGDGKPVNLGEVVALAQLTVQALVGQIVAGRMKPPRQIREPNADGIAYKILAIGWRVQLREWESMLDSVKPIHLIVVGTIASIVGMVASATPIPPPSETAGDGMPEMRV
jgi:hypothetical protein